MFCAFENTTKTLYYVQCPQETHDDISNGRLRTIKGKNGCVGLAIIRGFTLQTWCSVRSSAGDHVWILDREVDLFNLLVLDTYLSYDGTCKLKILCTCEDRDILVIRVKTVVFQLDIKNYKWKKIYAGLDSCTVYLLLWYKVSVSTFIYQHLTCALIYSYAYHFCRSFY
jgi:hypothetical protein